MKIEIEKLFNILDYSPWPTQKEAHESKARFKALFAGARYGKSLWASKEAIKEMFLNIGKWEIYRMWLVGPSYDQPSKEFRYIFQDMMKCGYMPKKKFNLDYSTPGPQMLLYEWTVNGKRHAIEIATRSEQNPDALLGEELNLLILSEGSRLKEETYDKYLRQRLGTRLGKVLLPTTPHGYNWLYRRFYLPAKDGKEGYWSKIVPVIENKLFPMEEYEKAREELPDEIFLEQYDGQFVAYTGLIYKRFTHEEHVITPFPIPQDPKWVHFMSIDPHPQTPCAILWIALDPHDTLFCYNECFVPDKTIPELARMIKMNEDSKIDYRRLIDPNAKYIDKLRGQVVSVQQQFRNEGVYCIEADNKFESAYYRISELLTPTPVYGKKDMKRPKLFVFNNCKELIHEFMTCDWETEKDNHMLDNLKYIVNDISPTIQETEEEIQQREEYEYSLLADRNIRTGY